ncbi:MAG TPA: carbohydrate binding family 9 domain-containing protein, partial [Gammaproteobacteria bacterium]|nr:carbohydrate binding family 9 domain-containing protein [Gammaproteobacteria bacterium]
MRTTLVVIAHFVAAGTVLGQELHIPIITEAPVLADFVGMTPPEEVRDRYAVVTDFTQREPENGAPSSQRTDVYLGYDSKNLYAVFVAHDDDPASVRANLAPRENIENDDRVGLLIDTFDDQRTGYGFRSSPLGVQWDARWAEVGRTEFDESFEAVWFTDGQVTAGGYVVLMTIPFRALRFAETPEQRWRIQLERLIPRTSEEAYWPAYSQLVDGRLNQAAVLN